MVDQETRERFQLVASEIIDAINAADYEGVRRDFDTVMLDKFTLEECRSFYSEKITGQYGKIVALEGPQFRSPHMAVFVARCERGSLDFTLVLNDNGQVAGLLFKRRLLVAADTAGPQAACSAPFGRG
jgi:hypothetical protein